MTLNSSGNVGIGTSSPAEKLDIIGSAKVSTRYYVNDGTNTLELGSTYIQAYLNSGAANTNLSFYTGTTERMRITSAGNVGIGTSSPTEKLHISGALRIQDTTYNAYLYANWSGGTSGLEATDSWMFVTNGTEKLRINSSGAIIFKGSSTSSNLRALWYNTETETSFYSTEGGGTTKQFNIYSSGSSTTGGRLRIEAAGDMLFSSYAPQKTLYFWMQGGDTLSTINNGSGTTMYFNYNGNGVIKAGSGGNTTLYAGSDIRIKQNINVVDTVLEKVLQLIPKTFEYKDVKDDKLYYGFIAQEVEEIFPEIVRTSEGISMCNDEEIIDQKSIESFSLVWASILTKAIQEQQDLIQELSAKVSALENKS
jgi:hypothetical protein